jgi:hypothetical protein
VTQLAGRDVYLLAVSFHMLGVRGRVAHWLYLLNLVFQLAVVAVGLLLRAHCGLGKLVVEVLFVYWHE